jgi:hypothetical protein
MKCSSESRVTIEEGASQPKKNPLALRKMIKVELRRPPLCLCFPRQWFNHERDKYHKNGASGSEHIKPICIIIANYYLEYRKSTDIYKSGGVENLCRDI